MLALKGGDCEDFAFVIATMLEASGISSYCIRVALGSIVEHSDEKTFVRGHHAWVMYFDEAGLWQILEPLVFLASDNRRKNPVLKRPPLAADRLNDFEYIPHFVFNREHLWRVRTPDGSAVEPIFKDYVGDRKFWTKFNPKFAISIHESLYNEALGQLSQEDLDIDICKVEMITGGHSRACLHPPIGFFA